LLKEINKDPKSKRVFDQDDKIVSGNYLMSQGIELPLDREFASIVIELTEVAE